MIHHILGFRGHDLLHDLNPLTIKAIKIPSQHPKKEPELPKSIKRAGDFLLSLLRIEYEKKKKPIAGLHIVQSLDGQQTNIFNRIRERLELIRR